MANEWLQVQKKMHRWMITSTGKDAQMRLTFRALAKAHPRTLRSMWEHLHLLLRFQTLCAYCNAYFHSLVREVIGVIWLNITHSFIPIEYAILCYVYLRWAVVYFVMSISGELRWQIKSIKSLLCIHDHASYFHDEGWVFFLAVEKGGGRWRKWWAVVWRGHRFED